MAPPIERRMRCQERSTRRGKIALAVKELENGAKVEDLCRKLGVSEATVYN
jgi:DeoR/GlpR family transcriptional regulator of sugar metabolism